MKRGKENMGIFALIYVTADDGSSRRLTTMVQAVLESWILAVKLLESSSNDAL